MKKIIRLTETQLHSLIKESVNKVLREDIFPKVGKKTSSYYSDRVPYDDEWADKYGSQGMHGQSEWEGEINQSIPNEVYGLAQRVENLGRRIFGGDDLDIDVSADRNDEWIERDNSSGTETSFRGVMTITVNNDDLNRHKGQGRINIDVRGSIKKFMKIVYSLFNTYCDDVNITSETGFNTTFHVNFSCPFIEGRNTQLNVTNKH